MCKLFNIINKKAEDYGSQYTAFGVFGAINYPIFYFICKYLVPEEYNSLFLRSIATLLSVVLFLHKYWPKVLKPYLPCYWYLVLFYCLPFFFTFMFFQNHGSSVWAFCLFPMCIFLMLLVDWVSGIIILLLGTTIGLLSSYFYLGEVQLVLDTEYYTLIFNYLSVIFICFFFVRDHQIFENKKIQTMKSIASGIAHELRTPLLAIRAGAIGSKKIIQTKEVLDSVSKKELLNVIATIEFEAYSANTLINMLLTKIKHSEEMILPTEMCSASEIIEASLSRYPFNSQEQKSVVTYAGRQDFLFHGNAILMTHVIFNLLKNALYYLGAAGKGLIEIKSHQSETFNLISFKDTGMGISKKDLPFVFDKFFSKTHNGSGLGLWFCKMVVESYRGSIICHSIENEFTEFLIKLPSIDSYKSSLVRVKT